MSDTTALQQARQLLSELTEAARTGSIIPFRLPGQLENIGVLLAEAGNEQLQQAAQPAAPPADVEQILKEQAEFMSTAVHELRIPMTSIRGYSDMLGNPAMGSLSDMQHQFLATIRTNARRMEGLLTDVSDISKVRGGTLRTSPKMDMFKNIAAMAEKKARPLAEELGRELVLDIPQGLPLLNVDGELLAKAMFKLVENGLRYTQATPGRVVISGGSDGSWLLVNIEDNGIGISPEDIAQLGTIYFRGDNDVVRNYKGSGLGIPIAYGILALLGGSVTVESEPDAGTRFILRLPGMA